MVQFLKSICYFITLIISGENSNSDVPHCEMSDHNSCKKKVSEVEILTLSPPPFFRYSDRDLTATENSEIQQHNCKHRNSNVAYFYVGSFYCASFTSRIECYNSVLTSRSSTIDFVTHFWIITRRILGCIRLLSHTSNAYSCPWINISAIEAACSLQVSVLLWYKTKFCVHEAGNNRYSTQR